jgi:hypothetical protein
MLTAQNKKTPSLDDTSHSSISTIGGFGKVLNSIQGLQQRLNDFSVDDINKAEANAHTLIQRLSSLLHKLNSLGELKHSQNTVRNLLGQIPETDYDLIGPDSLEKHPRLHAIVKASKLIRLHRLLKAAKESADSISFDPEAGQLEFGAPVPPFFKTGQDVLASSTFNNESVSLVPISPRETPQNSESLREVVETPLLSEPELSPPVFQKLQKVDDGVELNRANVTLSTLTAYPGHEASLIAPRLATIETTKASLPEDVNDELSESIESLNIEDQVFVIGTAEPNWHRAEAPFIAASQEHTEEPWNKVSRPESKGSQATRPNQNTPGNLDNPRSTTFVKSDFDERLLNNLIESYGEFVASPAISRSAEMPVSLEANFVAGQTVPSVEKLTSKAMEVSVPSVKRDGELDRQLKKIIKDYGEYDLYSNQGSMNLKKGGIAAFAVLGLVLGGVYFFRKPTTPTTPQPHSVKQSGTESPAARPKPAADGEGTFTAGHNGGSEASQNAESNPREPNALKIKIKPKQ